jgi:P-type Cu+ transporter
MRELLMKRLGRTNMRARAERGEATEMAERPDEVSAAVRHLKLSVGGMTCPRCPPLVEKALEQVDGVRDAHVNLATGVASIDHDPARADVHDLVGAIRGAGYSAGTATARVGIKGINCGSCVRQIEQALLATPGVVSAGVNLTQSVADVAYQPQIIDFEGIKRAIVEAGYGVAEPRGAGPEAGAEEERRSASRNTGR